MDCSCTGGDGGYSSCTCCASPSPVSTSLFRFSLLSFLPFSTTIISSKPHPLFYFLLAVAAAVAASLLLPLLLRCSRPHQLRSTSGRPDAKAFNLGPKRLRFRSHLLLNREFVEMEDETRVLENRLFEAVDSIVDSID